jgi:tRNA-splicing ligase RtcB
MALPGGLRRLDPERVKVPEGTRPGMRTHGIIYADEALEGLLDRKCIEQVSNVATLPGIVGASLAMPDVHAGYGFTIGGVAAFDPEEGIISPGGVGYDINCGVRLMRTLLDRAEVSPKVRELVAAMYGDVPAGVGSKGRMRLKRKELEKCAIEGARFVVERDMGTTSDLEHTESGGEMEGAETDAISDRAIERGMPQLGTLGSGNHFLEIQYVDEIFDQAAAAALGLRKDQVTVMIHTGSRGFGYQVCDDFLKQLSQAARKYGIELPDRELACAPANSPEGRQYMGAMRAAANYAWANRQAIKYFAEQAFVRVLNISPVSLGMSLVYDVAHNIAKLERHEVEGRVRELLVHRKGATRAFPKGHPEVPAAYRHLGQPVIIPGDMGRASYVLIGGEGAMKETWGSTCHGAGRVLSRHQAVKRISRKVARLKPMGVVKG